MHETTWCAWFGFWLHSKWDKIPSKSLFSTPRNHETSRSKIMGLTINLFQGVGAESQERFFSTSKTNNEIVEGREKQSTVRGNEGKQGSSLPEFPSHSFTFCCDFFFGGGVGEQTIAIANEICAELLLSGPSYQTGIPYDPDPDNHQQALCL